MAEFYEFHDSELTGIEYRDGLIVLKFEAYLHSWPEGMLVGSGTGWMQPIEIAVENPDAELSSNTFPLEILQGYLKAAEMQYAQGDFVEDQIPASLSGTGELEMHLEGIEESTGVYRSITIRGKSAAITHKGEARFVETLDYLKPGS